MIAILSVAALLCASACGKQAAQSETTSELQTTQPVTQANIEDDLALPGVNESGSTTAPVVVQSTAAPAVPAAVQQAPIMNVIADVQAAPPATQPPATQPPQTEAAAESDTPDAPEAPDVTTTTAPTTTQAAKSSPDLLNNSVLAPINSGTYTMSVSGFTKDKSPDDKLIKVSQGGNTGYRFAVPGVHFDYRVFSDGGKYYMADNNIYCELTKAQYDAVCGDLKNGFIQFNALQYQNTDETREGFTKYTREHFTAGNADVTLWYKNGALAKAEMKAGDVQDTLPMSVSGSADSGFFKLGEQLQPSTYENMKAYADFANMFFGAQS